VAAVVVSTPTLNSNREQTDRQTDRERETYNQRHHGSVPVKQIVASTGTSDWRDFGAFGVLEPDLYIINDHASKK
jgi:hypothetical protein